MKRVPKEIVREMMKILFVDDNGTITDDSARRALEYAKASQPSYRKTLYAGLFYEIRAYRKKQRLIEKQKKLLGDK